MMIIPIVVLLLLIVSFFAKIPGGVKRAAILIVREPYAYKLKVRYLRANRQHCDGI